MFWTSFSFFFLFFCAEGRKERIGSWSYRASLWLNTELYPAPGCQMGSQFAMDAVVVQVHAGAYVVLSFAYRHTHTVHLLSTTTTTTFPFISLLLLLSLLAPVRQHTQHGPETRVLLPVWTFASSFSQQSTRFAACLTAKDFGLPPPCIQGQQQKNTEEEEGRRDSIGTGGRREKRESKYKRWNKKSQTKFFFYSRDFFSRCLMETFHLCFLFLVPYSIFAFCATSVTPSKREEENFWHPVGDIVWYCLKNSILYVGNFFFTFCCCPRTKFIGRRIDLTVERGRKEKKESLPGDDTGPLNQFQLIMMQVGKLDFLCTWGVHCRTGAGIISILVIMQPFSVGSESSKAANLPEFWIFMADQLCQSLWPSSSSSSGKRAERAEQINYADGPVASTFCLFLSGSKWSGKRERETHSVVLGDGTHARPDR